MSKNHSLEFPRVAPVERPTLAVYTQELRRLGRLTLIVQEAIDKAARLRSAHHTLIYLAGALTGVDETTKERYAQTSTMIATLPGMFGYAPHLHGTDPIKHPNVTPQEVRDVDFLYAAVVPDLQVSFTNPIAHGSAIEAAWGEVYGVPLVNMVPQGVTLSRLTRGLDNIVHTIMYTDFPQDGLGQLREYLEHIER